MATDKHIAERVNDWVGSDHTFTASEIHVLAYALANDKELRGSFYSLVFEIQNMQAAHHVS